MKSLFTILISMSLFLFTPIASAALNSWDCDCTLKGTENNDQQVTIKSTRRPTLAMVERKCKQIFGRRDFSSAGRCIKENRVQTKLPADAKVYDQKVRPRAN